MKKAFLFSFLFTTLSILLSVLFKSKVAGLYDKGVLAHFFTLVEFVGLFMFVFIGFRASLTISYNKGVASSSLLAWFRLILIFFATLGYLCTTFAAQFLDIAPQPFLLAILFFAFGVYTYFSNQLGMYRLYKETNVISILEPTVTLFVFTCFLYFFGASEEALYISISTGAIICAIYISWSKKKLHHEPKIGLPRVSEEIKKFLKNSILGSLEFLFGMLILYFAMLFVAKRLPVDDLAEFVIVVKGFFMYFISIFVFPIVKFVLPELSKHIEKREFIEVDRLNKLAFFYSILPSAALFTLFYLAGEGIVRWIFGQEYATSSSALALLCLALFFVSLNTYQVALLKSLDKFFLSMSIRAVGSLLFFPIAFTVSRFKADLDGVSISLLLSYSVMCLLSLFFSKRELNRVRLKSKS